MNPVRTVSTTKSTFFNAYPRPLSPVYRRVIDELLVELHLATVNTYFVYSPFFALGVVTVFDALMEAYRPEHQRESIYAALCKALQLRPEVLRKDATTLLELMQSGDPQQRLKVMQQDPEVEDVGGLKAIMAQMSDSHKHAYSRILLVGIYTAFEKIATSLYPSLEERTEQFINTVSQPLNFSQERVKKDLELYRNNLDKMKQARAVVEEMVKAARRQQERRTGSLSTASAEATPAEPSETSS